MSVQSAPYYWLVCDNAGCTEKSTDGEYTAWADEHGAVEQAECSDWIVTDDGHFCPEHQEWSEVLDEHVGVLASHHDAADLISVEPS